MQQFPGWHRYLIGLPGHELLHVLMEAAAPSTGTVGNSSSTSSGSASISISTIFPRETVKPITVALSPQNLPLSRVSSLTRRLTDREIKTGGPRACCLIPRCDRLRDLVLRGLPTKEHNEVEIAEWRHNALRESTDDTDHGQPPWKHAINC